MRLPPPGCWACGAVPSEEDISLGAVLHPRSGREGGPWTRYACRECGVEGALGRRGVVAPPEAVGWVPSVVASLIEGKRERDLRRRAAEWMARFADGFEVLRDREAPPPPAPRPRRGPEPPPPRASRRAAGTALPSTQAEARTVLGVAAAATRKEIDAAFRKASKKCHPDLVAHLDEDFQKLAHEKFVRLKRAHELLTR
jgi:DnaJ-domain-containing protein 1